MNYPVVDKCLATPSSPSSDEDPLGAYCFAAPTSGSSGASCWPAPTIYCCSSSAVRRALALVGCSNSESFKALRKASSHCWEDEVPYKEKQR
jgi:hypothetical protein